MTDAHLHVESGSLIWATARPDLIAPREVKMKGEVGDIGESCSLPRWVVHVSSFKPSARLSQKES